MKILMGFLTFAIGAIVAIVFVYPWLYSTVHGLFESRDLGTIAAIAACIIAIGPIVWIIAILTMLVVAFVGD